LETSFRGVFLDNPTSPQEEKTPRFCISQFNEVKKKRIENIVHVWWLLCRLSRRFFECVHLSERLTLDLWFMNYTLWTVTSQGRVTPKSYFVVLSKVRNWGDLH